jgi:cell division protease FtsH
VGYADDSPQYLGGEPLTSRKYSEQTQRVIDTEVSRLLREAEVHAVELLRTHRSAVDALSQELLEHETVSGDVVRALAGVDGPSARDVRAGQTADAAAGS